MSNSCIRISRTAARPRGLLRLLADSQAGFGIVEVVISAVLVALLAAAAGTALIASGNISADQRHRSQADAIAQQDQERLRGMTVQQLSGLNQTRTVGPYEGTTFTVISTGKFLSDTGASTCASSGTGAAAYVKIHSEVDWAANNRSPVVQESLITPPTGGTLLTNVDDQNGDPLSGVAVTADGPSAESGITDADGCTVFGGMASGDYTVSISKSGYVDPNGDPSPVPTPTATVSGSGTSFPTPNPLQLGEAGAIQANFTARWSSSTNLTGQYAPSLSVSHSGRATPLITTPASPSGPITTPTSLFPFSTTGYTVWAGGCPGQQPANAADRTPPVLVDPGVLETAQVNEPAMNLRVWYPSQTTGNRRRPDQVKLTYTQTVGGACSEFWFPQIRTDAATSNRGSLQSPGQPYAGPTTVGSTTYNGVYTICAAYDADGTGPEPSRWAQLTNQTLTNFAAATTRNVVITATSPQGTCP